MRLLPLIPLLMLIFSAPIKLFAQDLGDSAVNNDAVPYYYKDQKQSLIKWEEVDPIEWMDLDYWKRIRSIKDSIPDWKVKQRDLFNHEIFGRVLSCVGVCKIYRGSGFSNASFASVIREGDEVQTMENSYMWLFLPEGTLIRISPTSSIAFKEFNVGIDRFFVQIRMNYGNMLYLSRSMSEYKESNLSETDTIFYPMRVVEANLETQKKTVNENELEKYLVEDQTTLNQYKRLNEFILKNNQKIEFKPTYSYITLPNATIQGTDLAMDFYYLVGQNSYFKQRKVSDYVQIKDEENVDVPLIKVQLRGYQKSEMVKANEGIWYQVDPLGKKIEEFSQSSRIFAFGELVTKRIPTILLAREYWLNQYNSLFFMQKKIDEKILATEYGYRLWNLNNQDELGERINFLDNYVNRIETGNLRGLAKLKDRMVVKEESKIEDIVERFYHYSIARYVSSLSVKQSSETENSENLNSKKHPFWKYLHLSGNP